jgi:hypothetical protein
MASTTQSSVGNPGSSQGGFWDAFFQSWIVKLGALLLLTFVLDVSNIVRNGVSPTFRAAARGTGWLARHWWDLGVRLVGYGRKALIPAVIAFVIGVNLILFGTHFGLSGLVAVGGIIILLMIALWWAYVAASVGIMSILLETGVNLASKWLTDLLARTGIMPNATGTYTSLDFAKARSGVREVFSTVVAILAAFIGILALFPSWVTLGTLLVATLGFTAQSAAGARLGIPMDAGFRTIEKVGGWIGFGVLILIPLKAIWPHDIGAWTLPTIGHDLKGWFFGLTPTSIVRTLLAMTAIFAVLAALLPSMSATGSTGGAKRLSGRLAWLSFAGVAIACVYLGLIGQVTLPDIKNVGTRFMGTEVSMEDAKATESESVTTDEPVVGAVNVPPPANIGEEPPKVERPVAEAPSTSAQTAFKWSAETLADRWK